MSDRTDAKTGTLYTRCRTATFRANGAFACGNHCRMIPARWQNSVATIDVQGPFAHHGSRPSNYTLAFHSRPDQGLDILARPDAGQSRTLRCRAIDLLPGRPYGDEKQNIAAEAAGSRLGNWTAAVRASAEMVTRMNIGLLERFVRIGRSRERRQRAARHRHPIEFIDAVNRARKVLPGKIIR